MTRRIGLAVALIVASGCEGGRVIELSLARSARETRGVQEKAVMMCLDAVARDMGRLVKEVRMAPGEARSYEVQDADGGQTAFLVFVEMDERIRVFFRSLSPQLDPGIGERAMRLCRAELDRVDLEYDVRRDSGLLY